MATYVTLFNFTEKGVREIKETLKRVEAAKGAAKQLGATIKEVLWLQGQYDIVVIIEASDEIAVSALLLNTLKAMFAGRPCAPLRLARWGRFWRRSLSSNKIGLAGWRFARPMS